MEIGMREVRDKYVRVRVTKKEKELIKKITEERGLKTEAEYLRYLINKDLKNE